MFNVKIKHKVCGKINLYYRCIDCKFKKLGTIDKKEVNDS